MHKSRIVPFVLAAVLGTFPAGTLTAQSGAGRAAWETLLQKPLPEDAEPVISVFSISGPPAPPDPRPIGEGHTHAGPVFVYILQGEIETQVEPDPPAIYKPGEFFYEAPGHVHRFQRNLSHTEPSQVIIFQAGLTGNASPVVKLLLQERLPATANQELHLLRLTIPPGALSEGRMHSGPVVVYVLEGEIEISGITYGAGAVFPEPANRAGVLFRNTNNAKAAKLLLYQVNEKEAPGAAH